MSLLPTLALLALHAPGPPGEPTGAAPAAPMSWDALAVEHLLNRAGFGGSPEEIRRGVELGQVALVEELLAGGAEAAFQAQPSASDQERRELRELPDEERRLELRMLRREDRAELEAFLAWWVERLLTVRGGSGVLAERMTLFWHGAFPSSQQDVQRAREMIGQHELLRRHALGSFRTLLLGIARDPAMLEYLDNDSNRKESPNENFARELLELFTLGEGHYSEEDVQEVARAFTGWTDREGVFVVLERQHDDGEKRVLGTRGRLDGDDVLELLLERQDCARHLAGRLLRYFEGVEPSRARRERYARLLRAEDWQLRPVLRALFLDREFYRAEALGTRVASPIDFLVGIARRAELDPPARWIEAGAALLGERLCFPPDVAGWRGGTAWITSGSLFLRANLAGVLIGALQPGELFEREAGEAFDPGELRLGPLVRPGWQPRLSLARELRALGLSSDEELARALAERLLAVPPTPALVARVSAFLASERERAGAAPGALLERVSQAEPCLRRGAHFVLSLPEAQLH